MKKRVFFRPDGAVAVLHCIESARLPRETDTEFLDRETAKAGLKDLPFDDVDEADIPPRDANRDKWRHREAGGKKQIFVDDTVSSKKDSITERLDAVEKEVAKLQGKPDGK